MNNIEIDLELITKSFERQINKAVSTAKGFEQSVNKSLNGVQSSMDGLSKQSQRTGDRISKSFSSASVAVGSFFGNLAAQSFVGFIRGIGDATGALVAFGKESLNAAIEAEETRSKFATVFQDVGGGAEQAADRLAQSYGLAGTEARKLLGDTGDLLTGFGFTGEAALEVSEQVQGLAVDLASFTNFSGGAEGASNALTKALLGETESLKSLGIAINQDAVNKKVAENAANGLTFATERQAKAQATLDLAFEQSKNAVGDYARTSQSTANQLRLFEARVNDLREGIGSGLKPAFSAIVLEVNRFLGSLDINQITNFVSRGVIFVIDGFKGLISLINPVISGFKLIGNTFALVGNTLRTGINSVLTIFAGFVDTIVSGYSLIVNSLPDSIVPDGITNGLQSLNNFTSDILASTAETTAEFAAATRANLEDVGKSFEDTIPESALNVIQAGATKVQEILKTNIAATSAIQTDASAKELEQLKATEEAKALVKTEAQKKEEERLIKAREKRLADEAAFNIASQEQELAFQQAKDELALTRDAAAIEQKAFKTTEDLTQLAAFEQSKIDIVLKAELAKAKLISDVNKRTLAERAASNKAEIAGLQLTAKTKDSIDKNTLKNQQANFRATLTATSQFFSLGEQLTKKNSAANKAFQIGNAVVNTYSAANRALASAPPPISYALAAAAVATGIANVVKIKNAGNFANGGIIGGGSFTGDNLVANVNSGEAILNSQQQKNFMRLANGAESSGSGGVTQAINMLGERIANMEIVLRADDTEIARSVSRGVQDGIIIGESR